MRALSPNGEQSVDAAIIKTLISFLRYQTICQDTMPLVVIDGHLRSGQKVIV